MPLLYLIIAHLLADFVFQPKQLLTWKHRSWKGILVHSLVHYFFYLLFFLPAFFQGNFKIFVVITLISFAHFAVDFAKIRTERKYPHYVDFFLLDQEVHFLFLFLAAFCFRNFAGNENALVVALPYSLLIYFIVAIVGTFCVEILQFQFLRGKNKQLEFKFNVRAMLMRWVIVSLIYGEVMWFLQ